MAKPQNDLCNTCQLIFKGKKQPEPLKFGWSFVAHHEALEELQAAVDSGCVLCTRILQHLGSEAIKLEAFRSRRQLCDPGGRGYLQFRFTYKTGEAQEKHSQIHYCLLQLNPDIDLNRICRSRSSSALNAATMQLMREWYRNCLDHHKKCSHRRSIVEGFKVPTRLIDIGLEGGQKCRLRMTPSEQLDSILNGYLTLSHRWSRAPVLQLNSETIGHLTEGIPISELPATFRDATIIARQLGIRYLWIDSLCIKQDSKQDWVREAPQMRHVYGCSAINIVAGHAEGPQDGLFGSRGSPFPDSFLFEAKWEGESEADYLLWHSNSFLEDFQDAPLTGRGWVFQELLLAPRLLQFGKLQMYWKCSELFACESWPQGAYSLEGKGIRYGMDLAGDENSVEVHSPRKLEPSVMGTIPEGPVAIWETLVSVYSGTAITFPEDRLVALSGIAKLFQQMFGDRYLAGLWWSQLARLLCWRSRSVGARPSYRAPSWSWASVEGSVYFTAPYDELDLRLLKYLVDTLDASIVPEQGDETAQIRGGRITVRGRLHSFVILSQDEEGITYRLDAETVEGDIDTFIPDATADDELEGLQLWVLPVMLKLRDCVDFHYYEVNGLVLRKKVGFSIEGSNDDVYQRVGSFYDHMDEEGTRVDDNAFGLHINWDEGTAYNFRRDSGTDHTIELV